MGRNNKHTKPAISRFMNAHRHQSCWETYKTTANIAAMLLTCLFLTHCSIVHPILNKDSPAYSDISTNTPSIRKPSPSWPKRKAALNAWKHWHIQGALSVRAGTESAMGSFTWRQDNQQYSFEIRGPLGIHRLRLTSNGQSATLTHRNSKTLLADNAESLMREKLGWSLPLQYFRYWVRGLPAPAPAQHGTQAQFDCKHRLIAFEQAGWHITLSRFHAPRPLADPELELPTQIQGVWPDRAWIKINIQRWR